MSLSTLLAPPYNFQKVCDVGFNTKPPKGSTIPTPAGEKLQFNRTIDSTVWRTRHDWIYVFVVNGEIVKIGGTAAGLSSRTGSYTAGTTKHRKSGTCATTNFIVYQHLLQALNARKTVEMYASLIESKRLEVNHWGEVIDYKPELFHPFETRLMERFFLENGHYPILSKKSGNNEEVKKHKKTKTI
jgi:hypothetical protein